MGTRGSWASSYPTVPSNLRLISSCTSAANSRGSSLNTCARVYMCVCVCVCVHVRVCVVQVRVHKNVWGRRCSR